MKKNMNFLSSFLQRRLPVSLWIKVQRYILAQYRAYTRGNNDKAATWALPLVSFIAG